MTPELIRFIANTRTTFRQLSTEQLYQLALSLRHELSDRELDSVPEADALVAALLGDARVSRARLYSTLDPTAE
jgi:hypothetical protein